MKRRSLLLALVLGVALAQTGPAQTPPAQTPPAQPGPPPAATPPAAPTVPAPPAPFPTAAPAPAPAAAPTAPVVTVSLRPEGEEVSAALTAALRELSGPALNLRLEEGGPRIVLGSALPFNPDLAYRRRGDLIEINPAGPLAVPAAVRAAVLAELGADPDADPATLARLLAAPAAQTSAAQTSAAQTSATPAARPRGDFNGDGRVDIADLAILMANLGRSGANLPGDLNGDGRVDETDLRLFAELYTLP